MRRLQLEQSLVLCKLLLLWLSVHFTGKWTVLHCKMVNCLRCCLNDARGQTWPDIPLSALHKPESKKGGGLAMQQQD